MYSRQLDFFVKAAEQGSFSGAAQALLVTPSAVIQQVKGLEERLGVQLFVRSSRGVEMTEAGKYFYEESKNMIRHSEEVLNHMEHFRKKENLLIHAADGPLHPLQMLYQLWFQFHAVEPQYEIVMETVRDFVAQYPEHVDLVEGVFFRERWHTDFTFLQVTEMPVWLGVFDNHPLKKNKIITYKDLHNTTVVTIYRGLSEEMDRLWDQMAQREVELLPVHVYDNATEALCVTHQYALLVPLCWQKLFANLTLIPGEWDCTLPYGFFLSPKISQPARQFAEFIREQTEESRRE